MWFRWIIRTLFVLPILLSVYGWYWSGTHVGFVFYAQDRHWGGWQTSLGVTGLVGGWDSPMQDGWMQDFSTRTESRYWPANDEDSFYGFSLRSRKGMGGTTYIWSLPYWFVVMAAVGVLAGVWWVTGRRRGVVGPAFPVEADNKPACGHTPGL